MTNVRANIAKLTASIREVVSRPRAKRILGLAQYALFAGVVVYLFIRLSEVGWGDVADNLPSSPLFYLIFTLRYLALPLSEIPAYETTWNVKLWRHFSAFLRKRVYNFAVMGYSGEGFFSLWARRALNLSDRDILVGVKDNNLISALVSNIATALMVITLYFGGTLEDDLDALPGSPVLFALAFASAFTLAIAVTVFRRQVFHLPKGVMRRIFAINALRMAVIMILQVLLYWSALPGPPLAAWFIFVALQLVLSRIPFIPNIDIVFLTAAIHFAEAAGVSDAAIAGMLVAEAGLSQIFNIALFAATTHLALSRPSRETEAAGSVPSRDRADRP